MTCGIYLHVVIKVIDDIETFKHKALQWASSFEACCYLDANHFADPLSKFDVVIAAGVKRQLTAPTGNAFSQLEAFKVSTPDWIFGFFTYDLKNEIEQLNSTNPDHLQFPDLYFFAPRHLIFIKGDEVMVQSDEAGLVWQDIESQIVTQRTIGPAINIQTRFTRNEYIDTVRKIKDHINRGDIYVTNFCQEFYAEDATIEPLSVFDHLNKISPNPFNAFFKMGDQYILSASPERFLAKRGMKLTSQPIKGTSARQADVSADEQAIRDLQNHPKEQQENVMIVDLVRNDLTRSAVQGTVQVDELFGIYSFKQVHQMISTVSCEVSADLSPVQVIKNTFPMGSMTGAPKVSAMRLMERYERSKRGVYSGALGYFDPDGDFDFSVVIRTLLYNAGNKYLSFHTGSAITVDADPEKEYEECLLKARAIIEALASEQ